MTVVKERAQMKFDPVLAEIRFGCGLSPRHSPAVSVAQILDRLSGPDYAATSWPIPGPDFLMQRVRAYAVLNRTRIAAQNDNSELTRINEQMKQRRLDARNDQLRWLGQALLRRANTSDGLRERLAFFWSDHFTARGKTGVFKHGTAPYVEGAIRPYIADRFSDMLRAVITAPLMLHYLDQWPAKKPSSTPDLERPLEGASINENLARELLELHTLGVDGPYGQPDVEQLARLLTGMGFWPKKGFLFRPDYAEPGSEVLLGKSYGGSEPARLDEVLAMLDDLATHPATAEHLSRKLAVHFISDNPDPDLVGAMATRWRDTSGDLPSVYSTMLEHPAAWDGPGNVKQPIDFIGSTLRALGIKRLPVDNARRMMVLFGGPMQLMGQHWEEPGGPDGWPEVDSDWITAQRLAGRLQWALTAPLLLQPALPDPRDFVRAALGDRVPEALVFAANGAEGRREGIALVLSAPAFQRM
jgi:uncharacterized protein (DUF1800 family)